MCYMVVSISGPIDTIYLGVFVLRWFRFTISCVLLGICNEG